MRFIANLFSSNLSEPYVRSLASSQGSARTKEKKRKKERKKKQRKPRACLCMETELQRINRVASQLAARRSREKNIPGRLAIRGASRKRDGLEKGRMEDHGQE